MAGRYDLDALDRKLRPIYDALDSRQYKVLSAYDTYTLCKHCTLPG